MPQTLSEKDRSEILEALSQTVSKRFFNRDAVQDGWQASVAKHRPTILAAESAETFELAIAELLKELKTSHVGFYHSDLSRCTAKMAICADYDALPTPEGNMWVFLDVHEGGPAFDAGIKPGDALVSVGGQRFSPPNHPYFPIGATVAVDLISSEGRHLTTPIMIPKVKVKRNQLPKVEPSPIAFSRRLDSETGYLRIASYPGAIGVEIAHDISTAVSALDQPKRLVIDLRGNTGGGIGVLRLMSLLTPDRRLVGSYSSGKMRTDSIVENGSFVFDRIPGSKAGLIPLAMRFLSYRIRSAVLGQKTRVCVATETLGPQSFHGRTVLLVNRHTTSANEMLLAFARRHQLATIVGEPTPGRVLGGSKFRLPCGYWVAMPTGSYQTTEGNPLEGQPIEPDIRVPFDVEAARQGRDLQLEAAVETVHSL